jgi:hypothetical protein
MFEVPAGGRRFRALELLVRQERMTKTQPVPCGGAVHHDGRFPATSNHRLEAIKNRNTGRLEIRHIACHDREAVLSAVAAIMRSALLLPISALSNPQRRTACKSKARIRSPWRVRTLSSHDISVMANTGSLLR